jgi:hypothetical protein
MGRAWSFLLIAAGKSYASFLSMDEFTCYFERNGTRLCPIAAWDGSQHFGVLCLGLFGCNIMHAVACKPLHADMAFAVPLLETQHVSSCAGEKHWHVVTHSDGGICS